MKTIYYTYQVIFILKNEEDGTQEHFIIYAANENLEQAKEDAINKLQEVIDSRCKILSHMKRQIVTEESIKIVTRFPLLPSYDIKLLEFFPD